MVKEKRILNNYIGWLILGLFICFIGIKNTYASEISQFDFMGKDFNTFWIEQNSSTSGTLSVTVSDITQIKPYINIIIASTYDPNFVITSNNYFTDTWTKKLYSYGTTTILGYTANVYVIQFSTKGLNNWNCSVDGTNCYVSTNIRMTGPSDYSAVYQLRSISLTDVVLDDDYLKNITVNQNNEIIDQNQTMIDQNQSIIQGQDKLEDAIVDSNKETQDVIKDQFNSCYKNVLNNFSFETQTKNGITITNNGDNTITINGTSTGYTAFEIQKLTLIPDSYYTLSGGINSNQVIQIIEGKDNPLTNENGYVTWYNKGTSGTLYIVILGKTTINNAIMKPMLTNDNILHEYIPPQQEICTNKLDETKDALNNIGGALTDDSPTDMSGLGDSAGWLPAGPVDSILTLPLTLFTTLSDNLSNNTCTTAVLPLPFVKKNINLPCIKTLYDKIGITGTLFTTAGIIASCFILFNYLLSLYNWVDKTLTMRENTMPGYYDDNWGGGA